jgi:hypothetical protein
LGDKPRSQSYASAILDWWRKQLKIKTGGGRFNQWDNIVVDAGKLDFCNDQVDRVSDTIGYEFTMSDIIDWEDLAGMHGLATGRKTALKVRWEWLEFLRFLIVWSFYTVGIDAKTYNVTDWTPNADDFVTTTTGKKKTTSNAKKTWMSKETKSKKKSTVTEQLNGARRGAKRALGFAATQPDNYELAMAISVSEEQSNAEIQQEIEEERQIVAALEESVNLEVIREEQPAMELDLSTSFQPADRSKSTYSPTPPPATKRRIVRPVFIIPVKEYLITQPFRHKSPSLLRMNTWNCRSAKAASEPHRLR